MLHHDKRRKGKQHVQDLGISPILFSLSLSPLFIPLSFSGIGKELRRGRRIMRKDVGMHKGNHQL
jgi:hypothetical protein